MHIRKEDLAGIEMLTARSDFLIVQNKGKRWVSKGLAIHVRKNDLDHIRVGYTITKKVFKSAVKRNRVKRRLRAVAAQVLSKDGQVGYDYILVGRNDTLTKPFDVLVSDFKWCLKKLDMRA